MSKKHYIAIAAIYRAQWQDASSMGRGYIRETANKLADYFAIDNPRFDRARFLCACGVETQL